MAARDRIPGQVASQKQIRVPVPLGGLNTSTSYMTTPPGDALFLENFTIRSYGLEIRKGWKYWYNDPFPAAVTTLMAYVDPVPANRKIFASTAEVGGLNGPIYDVTTAGATPPAVPDLTPSTAPDQPGEWSSIMFTTPGGSFLCAVQAGAGYYTYTDSAGWVEVTTGGGAGQMSFPDATTTKDLCFVTSWKNRLWFIARNSTKAYYLDVDSITGAAEVFDFGPLIKSGGVLQLLLSWTYDGGDGLDDSLIVVGDQGDMLVYQGTDPASINTFALKGSWYIGRIPPGRRNFTNQGGDLWIITEYGILSVSDLVSGRITSAVSETIDSGKYNPTLAQNVAGTMDERYWFLLPLASEQLMICGSPFVNAYFGYRVSYTMYTLTRGWSTTQNFSPYAAVVSEGQLFFSDRDGYMCLGYFGYRDGDSYDSSTPGNEVTARLVAPFLDYGSPTANKTPTRVRLIGQSEGVPSYYMKIKSEYNMEELLSTTAPVTVSGALWDSALWDSALWQYAAQTFKRWFGVSGFGKKLSLQLVIRGTGYTLLSDYEVTYKEGNGK